MKKLLIRVSFCILLYGVFCMLTPFNTYLRNRSIQNQINYLDKNLSAGLDDIIQENYPEGKIFSNAIFALSVIEFSKKKTQDVAFFSKIIDRCINRLLDPSTALSFDENLDPKYGAFYNGWINYSLKTYIESDLFAKSKNQQKLISKHQHFNEVLGNTQKDSSRIIDTYADAYWPADNLVAAASLDQKDIENSWVNKITHTSTHPSKLIPHYGNNIAKARGSSQALIIYFLHQNDPQKAASFNQDFNKIFFKNFFGITFVKEYEEEEHGDIDIDSGPIIFDIGAVATIMNIKIQAALKTKNYKSTWALLNFLGAPINIFKTKFYLFKQEPMFDVFMLWCCVEF